MNSVAVAQMKSSEDKKENLKTSLCFIEEAAKKKANLICFPEFQMAFSPPNQTGAELVNLAESIDGKFISALRVAARKHKIGIVASIYEKIARSRRVYDTAIMISSSGLLSSVYRKIHLYDALGFRESNKLVAGKTIERPLKTKTGNIGLLICYDIRFPEMSRILAASGAEILIVPSAWVQGRMKEEHWQTMLKARAIENGAYVVAPDQVGNIYCGRSMVIDPFGLVLLDMGSREGIGITKIDMKKVRKIRNSLPLLKNRRTDVYKDNLDALT